MKNEPKKDAAEKFTPKEWNQMLLEERRAKEILNAQEVAFEMKQERIRCGEE